MSDDWRPRVARVPVLVWPVPVDPAGVHGPTRGQAAGRHWLRSSPGRYVDLRRRPDCVEQRILEAGAPLILGYVTGWAALRWAGAAFFDGLAPDGRTSLPVDLAANGERLRGRAGVTVVRDRAGDEIHQRRGLHVACPERALLDQLRRMDLPDAVAAIDMATAAELTSNRRFRAYLATRPGARGLRGALAALDRAVEGADSAPGGPVPPDLGGRRLVAPPGQPPRARSRRPVRRSARPARSGPWRRGRVPGCLAAAGRLVACRRGRSV